MSILTNDDLEHLHRIALRNIGALAPNDSAEPEPRLRYNAHAVILALIEELCHEREAHRRAVREVHERCEVIGRLQVKLDERWATIKKAEATNADLRRRIAMADQTGGEPPF